MAPESLPLDQLARLITDIFRRFDDTRNGLIAGEDLAALLPMLHPKAWPAERVDCLLAEAGLRRDTQIEYRKFIRWLTKDTGWPALKLPDGETPIKRMAVEQREKFLQQRWRPFTQRVKALLDSARTRQVSGFSAHEIMPSPDEIGELTLQCLELTKQWHGCSNVSAFYEIFMEMAELDGHSPYLFRDIPQARSEDGCTRVLDAQARRRLYSGKTGGGQPAVDVMVGRMPQAAGESAIDNLLLPGLLELQDWVLLRAGYRVQQFFFMALRWKQRRILRQLGLSTDCTDGESRALAKQRVRELVERDGITTSLAHSMLVQSGCLLESYGQLPAEARAALEVFVAEQLKKQVPQKEIDEELKAYLEHCKKHPGRAFNGSATQHKLMLLRCMASPGVKLLWRSDVAQFTQHRYFVVPWTRSVPLLALAEEGDHSENSLVELRAVSAAEVTRFRKNVFAYGESHGLGQSGGGWNDDPAWSSASLIYKFGALLCMDEAAKVPNHWVTDIEKIIKDCLICCPDGGLGDALPDEVLHDSGQNPVVASSIGLTQHTQVTRASAEDFPLMTQQSDPKWSATLGATIDLVPVGREEDAFFLSARSRSPDSLPFLKFLTDLRAHLVTAFGRAIDFTVTCHPTPGGEYIVNFAPVACMQKIKVPKGEGCMGLDFDFQNPDTEEKLTQQGLPCASVDCSHGKGNILALSDSLWKLALEGRPIMQKLYDFNRKPGVRHVIKEWLSSVSLG